MADFGLGTTIVVDPPVAPPVVVVPIPGPAGADGGSSFPDFTGSGSPEGVVTADVGKSYVDTTNGALYFKAVGVGDPDTGWQGIGKTVLENNALFLTCPSNGRITISDEGTNSGLGNGFTYQGHGTDGDQSITIWLGPVGEFETRFNADGSTVLPGALTVAGDVTAGGVVLGATALFGTIPGLSVTDADGREARLYADGTEAQVDLTNPDGGYVNVAAADGDAHVIARAAPGQTTPALSVRDTDDAPTFSVLPDGTVTVAGDVTANGVLLGAGGGAVDSVNTLTGAVVLTAADVGADAVGDAAAAQIAAVAAADTYTDAHLALEVTRANGAYDGLGAAAAVTTTSIGAQPVDSDLTAIAALTTTTFGRALLALADAAALRTTAGLGDVATHNASEFATPASLSTAINNLINSAPGTLDTLGEIATQLAADESGVAALVTTVAGKQPLDSDLTAIAALTTTTYGRAFLALADAAAARTALALGTLATQSGTFSGTSSGTNTGDQVLPTTLPPNGAAGGALSGTYPNPGLVNIAESQVTNLTTDLAAKAPLASPALTGTPTAPTATAADNSTKLATTAYTDAAAGLKLSLTGGTMSGAIAMGAHKVTGLTNGSASDDAAAFGQLGIVPTGTPAVGYVPTATSTSAATWQAAAGGGAPIPTNYLAPTGAAYETFPRNSNYSQANPTISSGTLYLAAIALPIGFSVGHIALINTATGAAVSPTHWWFGLYDSSRVQLALTADQTSTAWAGGTLKSLAIATTAAGAASAFVTTYTGLHYIGYLMTASTTALPVACAIGAPLAAAPPILYGISDGAQTTPPAFPHTATAMTSQTSLIYAYCGS